MLLNNEHENKLIIETLALKHISMLASSDDKHLLRYFQWLLVSKWIAIAEEKMKLQNPTRESICYVASEQTEVISYLTTRPSNLRRTCWSISSPKLVKKPIHDSQSNIYHKLLSFTLKNNQRDPKSWLTTIPVWENQTLSISRELGFQPLKVIKYWAFPGAKNVWSNQNPLNIADNEFCWRKLDKNNTALIWRLQQSKESGNLRTIFDRGWQDILAQRTKYTGVLISNTNDHDIIPIVGLISSICPIEVNSLELVRGLLWDERLSKYLPLILNNLSEISKLTLETTSEDKNINFLLKTNGWEVKEERVLLGRNVLRRNKVKSTKIIDLDLKEIVSGLNPQTELPTNI